MIKGSMSSVPETDVGAKLKKTDCFAENGIFSVLDRIEHALSTPHHK